jgi:septin family protein
MFALSQTYRCSSGETRTTHCVGLLLQDTKGFSNLEDAALLVDSIESQFEAYFDAEHDEKRSQPVRQLVDPRADVCLYFLSPHNITALDIEVIGRISKLVPIVPVMAKVCDSYLHFAL